MPSRKRAPPEDQRPRPILLFDALSLLYRAFFALPPMNTTGGEPTSGLYGLAAVMLKLLHGPAMSPSGGAWRPCTTTFLFRRGRDGRPSDAANESSSTHSSTGSNSDR